LTSRAGVNRAGVSQPAVYAKAATTTITMTAMSIIEPKMEGAELGLSSIGASGQTSLIED
jgi:hypothetical protein